MVPSLPLLILNTRFSLSLTLSWQKIHLERIALSRSSHIFRGVAMFSFALPFFANGLDLAMGKTDGTIGGVWALITGTLQRLGFLHRVAAIDEGESINSPIMPILTAVGPRATPRLLKIHKFPKREMPGTNPSLLTHQVKRFIIEQLFYLWGALMD